jgi:hypothetical protein
MLIMKDSRRRPLLGISPPRRGQHHDIASSLTVRRCHGSAMHATLARAYAQNGGDLDGGFHLQPGPGQGVDPSSQSGEALAETTKAKSLGISPLLTTDGVDRMYHQLAEIHAIAAAQLAECGGWCQTDSTPRLA